MFGELRVLFFQELAKLTICEGVREKSFLAKKGSEPMKGGCLQETCKARYYASPGQHGSCHLKLSLCQH